VLFDLSSSPKIDLAGVRFFKQFFMDLEAKNISLKVTEAPAPKFGIICGLKVSKSFWVTSAGQFR
jgi:hypothetical protein